MSEIILPEENLSSDVLENKDAVVAEPVTVEAGTVAEVPAEEAEATPENGEAAQTPDESPAPAFDWGERDSLDEDELFGQIGLPDGGPTPEESDLFDNDGPDADLPDEGFSDAPEVAPSPVETDGGEPEAASQIPEKKKELSESDLEVRRKYAVQRIGAARVRFCFARHIFYHRDFRLRRAPC